MHSYLHNYVKITIEDDVFDEILTAVNRHQNFSPSTASYYNGEEYIKDDREKRRSKSTRVKDTNLDDIIETIIRSINIEAKWNFELTALEEMECIRYDVGDYFKWHLDEADWSPGRRKFNLMRKLSYTVLLNDEFTGGELDLFTTRDVPINLKKKQIIVFHSDILHQVRPVTSGTRYSLVGWIQGPPWR